MAAKGLFLVPDLEEEDQQDHRGPADGQIDVEHPAPRRPLHKQAADYRSQAGADSEYAKHEAHEFPALSQWHQIDDDEVDEWIDAAAALALHGPTSDQHIPARCPA